MHVKVHSSLSMLSILKIWVNRCLCVKTYKPIPDFQKRRHIFNYAYICVSDCVYKGGIPIHSHLMCFAGGMFVWD